MQWTYFGYSALLISERRGTSFGCTSSFLDNLH
ncbi:hypothetical protein ACNKHR_01995 [Shigella flexneri]